MADWKKLLSSVLLADGKIDDAETKILRKEILADGEVDQEEVDFLVALRNGTKKPTSAFEKFFFDALSQNLLDDGKIDAAEAKKLRKILFADGKIDDGEKQFIKALKRGAKQTSPEFDKLYQEIISS